MPSLVDRIKDRFETTFHKAYSVAGICSSPSLEQVRDLLEHGEKLTERAKQTTEFANAAGVLGDGGEKLAGAAGAINDIVQKGSKAAGDLSAACEISEAIEVLNRWSVPNSKVSNQDAAKAFDKLFGGAARYMGKLPFPANQYAKLLEAIKQYNFFSNMQKTMDFANDPNNPEGRQLLELERQGN
jgi:hypothetical protein